MTTNELLLLVCSLASIILGLIAWIGNGMVDELKKIAASVNKIEAEIGILSNDHNNLKEDVKELKQRVNFLET